jgi:hypothetical protein
MPTPVVATLTLTPGSSGGYDVGDQVTASVAITDTADPPNAVDPTTLVFRTLPPGSVDTTLTYGTDAALVKDATGAYHVDVSLVRAGTWHFRWKGTGTAVFAEEAEIMVRASAFPNP